MSHNLFTLTAAAFLGIGTAAHQVGATAAPASLLALPLIYGSPKQVTANCSVTNSGFEPVTISAAQIDDSTGLSFALMANSCTGTLNPGLSCGMVANIFPGATYSCKALISPSKEFVRGSLELRDNVPNVIQNISLQ
jgi:hypothetical protein